ncbi:DoxX family protein [Tenacibaculum maritimum]|nr:DoxX family protein [Tenacibaculum maritimum]CAA0242197.1 Probable transmembrane hypothetical protein [Tenacibaculum maritimum]
MIIKMKKHLPLVLKIIVAFILLQTLFFKFTGAQESVDLFTKVAGNENEKIMRIGTGILELIAAILLFTPNKAWLGALLSSGVMGGAIMSHLTVLGIIHNNDGGTLFISAIVVLAISSFLLIFDKGKIPLFR